MIALLLVCIAGLVVTQAASLLTIRRLRTRAANGATASASAIAASSRAAIERLRVLETSLGAARVGVCTFDVASRLSPCSSTLAELLGYTDGRTQLSFEDWTNTMHPDDRDEVLARSAGSLVDGEGYTFEYRVCLPNGDIRWVRAYGMPEFDAAHQPRAIHAMLLDITPFKSLEIDAVRLDRRLVVLSRIGLFTTWEFDPEAGIYTIDVDASQRPSSRVRTQQLGLTAQYTIEEVLERHHPDDRAAMRELIERVRVEDIDYEMDVRFADSRGNYHWSGTHGRVVRDPNTGKRRVVGVTQAIKRRKEAEQRLKETDERLQRAVRGTNDGLFELNLKTQVLWLSPRYLEMLGYEPHEGPTTTDALIELTHPEDRERILGAFRQHVKTGGFYDVEVRVLHKSGHYRWYRLRGRCERDADGQPETWAGSQQDINETRNYQEQIRDAERRLERASLSSSEGHFEYDLVNKTVWHSAGFHALLGLQPGELPTSLEEATRRLILPKDVERQRLLLVRHFKYNEPFEGDFEVRMPDGNCRWFHFLGAAERDEQGRAIRMAGSMRDIHQQRLTEQALKETQQRFLRAISGTRDGLWELDITTGLLWRSPRLEVLLGYEPGELPSDSTAMRTLLHPDDLPEIVKLSWAHFQRNVPFDIELRVQMKSGAYRWYRVRAQAERDEQDRVQRLSGSIEDIHAARAARDQLLQATAAAEAANRAKSEFLANMSHEIRTPMNAVIGLTDLLLETSLTSTQRDYGETARESAAALLTIINDILDFSKVEAGKLDLEEAEMDLRSTVRDVTRLLAIEARHKQLEVTSRVDPALPAYLRGDAGRVRQVLINLGNNAVKFTQRGQIAIDLKLLEQNPAGGRVRCEVRDTGVGIAADNIDALFKPFSQLDSSSTRRFGGTGLGLSISKRLIEMMGGEVGVESEPGVGSCFWFTALFKPSALLAMATPMLPASMSNVPEEPVTPPRTPTRCNILLAEDNLVNQKVARRMLEKLGYHIDVAVDGRAVVEAWQAGNYDLILMDRHMPVLDGCGAAREIRRLEAQGGRKPIPIIAFTADAMKGAEQECFDAGMDAYLTKPIDKEKLAAWIDSLTEGGTPVPATEVSAQSVPPVQWLRLVAAVGGDEDLARDVASLFVASGQTDMRSIIQALADRDYAALGERASALKGASESVRATSAQVAAERLEAAARGGVTDQIPQLTDALAREVARTIDYLKQRVV